MQQVLQKKSYNSVTVFWLNKQLLREKINEAVEKLVSSHPEVQEVVLFGSVARDKETASSDVDFCVIVSASSDRFIDRPGKFLDFFSGIGLSVDLFVYTRQEVENGSAMVHTALKKGKVLYSCFSPLCKGGQRGISEISPNPSL